MNVGDEQPLARSVRCLLLRCFGHSTVAVLWVVLHARLDMVSDSEVCAMLHVYS